ncbi:bifunctional diaminohydroxyphosphoribosylaminopyrimidine deaminase/5-amino-6-(5-phosphoribosylamino)uracil reductase RibD [Roseovarius sp. D0-M9]|uniref:bifunctional diaminohydroxyphosphoribosylaminopyrimidine deaminase/5-amino-6-(5-phosphoribosylamino)uracil reductase RibD n=1 Tax=Roseovarius sp. D0-M9 TaxID=3127117 RepID=UPI003FA72FBF
MTSDADIHHMRTALALGRRGLGQTWPNPSVGCIITLDGRVVGRGWTQPGGRPHAETQALGRAGALARGGTAYVTLEPCAHHGKTPPCADALIAAGVARVVIACGDPDPRVSGRGIATLRAAGVDVQVGLLQDEARRDLGGFLGRITQGRPEILLKLATSFDGRIATASGQSRWITGPEARRVVHAMRARHDAVMVGAGTVRSDDPMLTVRSIGAERQPVRVVVSRGLNLPQDGRLALSAREVPLWLVHGTEAEPALVATWQALGARMIACPEGAGGIDMSAAIHALGAAGLTRIFCEGGGALAASLLKGDLVDRLAHFAAGLALGADARAGVGALEIAALETAPRFALDEVHAVGADALMLWRRA